MTKGSDAAPVGWVALPGGDWNRPRRSWPWVGSAVRVLVLVAVAAFAAYRGAWIGFAVVMVMVTVLSTVAILSPSATSFLDAGAAKVGRLAILVVSALGVGLIELVVILPARAVSALRTRSALTGAKARSDTTWRLRSAPVSARAHYDRPWMRDVPGHRPRTGMRVMWPLRILPYLAVFLAVDLVAGTVVAGQANAPWLQPTQRVEGAAEPGVPGVPSDLFEDMSGVPALAGLPWADECMAEADRLEYDYVQYLVRKVQDTDGNCVSVLDGVRASYEPAGTDIAEVWIVGGSAAFGVGQRDEHTIASALARQSEADGNPARVVNLAVPGFTAYQEALLLEQLLAVRPPPDLVVMYHGINDVAAQLAAPGGMATWLPATVWRSDAPANRRSLWGRWRDASFVARLVNDYTGAPADAAAGVDDSSVSAVAAGTVRVLDRSVRLAQRIGAMHGVPVVAVFQASRASDRGPVADLVVDQLPDVLLDGSGALDSPQAVADFIDSVHVNENGASIVAEDLRRQLRGTVLGEGGT